MAAAVAAVALLAVVHVVNRLTVDTDLLRLDLEANVPTWVSTVQFALAGIAWLAVAAAARFRPRRWAFLGALLLLLSLDELAMLHERLSAEIGATAAEWIVQPLAGLAVIALLVGVGQRAGGDARRLLGATVVVLVLGHLAELATPAPETGALAAALKIVEESFELLVGALALAAAAAQAEGVGLRPAVQ